jgi:hypothetical protein
MRLLDKFQCSGRNVFKAWIRCCMDRKGLVAGIVDLFALTFFLVRRGIVFASLDTCWSVKALSVGLLVVALVLALERFAVKSRCGTHCVVV